ncbi:hypothetical protein BJY01DRAFT_255473 [Aspergillus pseudoustus]|uniref:Nucleoside phosphorylase domain-containing protein n=1 Tax=Aspergillus pseudoustus TaxID=1810923 RepID=A0ABR4IK21_9EURO
MGYFSDTERAKYTIAWVCCEPFEHAAAECMLDKRHGSYRPPGPLHSQNAYYTLGEIGGRNVVIIFMANAVNQIGALATLFIDLEIFFPNIQVSMLVTIGRIPNEENGIRLGDVVISSLEDRYGGIANVDRCADGADDSIGIVHQPLPRVQQGDLLLGEAKNMISSNTAEMRPHEPEMVAEYASPGAENDLLFPSDCHHTTDAGRYCKDCYTSKAIARPARKSTEPQIHFGTIGGRRDVVTNPVYRDGTKKDVGALAVQFGAEYMMDSLRPLVITGVAKYGDTHTHGRWRMYAAATAAACAKDLVLRFRIRPF